VTLTNVVDTLGNSWLSDTKEPQSLGIFRIDTLNPSLIEKTKSVKVFKVDGTERTNGYARDGDNIIIKFKTVDDILGIPKVWIGTEELQECSGSICDCKWNEAEKTMQCEHLFKVGEDEGSRPVTVESDVCIISCPTISAAAIDIV